MSVGVLVFARMSSQRWPGKALQNFGGMPLLAWVLKRAQGLDAPVLLATSQAPADLALVELAAALGVPSFRGELDDVLARALAAAQALNVAHVLRLCGDRPYFDVDEAAQALALAQRQPELDLISNRLGGQPAPGLTTELLSQRALLMAAQSTSDPLDREHLSRFHYAHLQRLRSAALAPSPSWELRVALAVDTEADGARLQPRSDWTPAVPLAEVRAHFDG